MGNTTEWVLIVSYPYRRLFLPSHDEQITSSPCCCVAASFSQESVGGSEKGCSDLFITPSPPALCIIHAELTNSSHLGQGLDLNLRVIYHREVYLQHLNTVKSPSSLSSIPCVPIRGAPLHNSLSQQIVMMVIAGCSDNY